MMLPRLLFQGLFLLTASLQGAETQRRVVLQLRGDHQFQFAGYYAAIWQGFYAEKGLDVEARSAFQPDGSRLNPVEEVTSGRAQFGIGGADVLLARESGHDLVLLASIFQHSPAMWCIRGDVDYQGPADFSKLRVLWGVDALLEAEMLSVLASEGIPKEHLRRVFLPPGSSPLREFMQGNVDVIPGYSICMPFILGEMSLPFIPFSPRSYGVDFYGDSPFVGREMVENDPELVAGFTQATLEGWRFALDYPEETARRIARELPRVLDTGNAEGLNLFQASGVRRLTMHEVVEPGHMNPLRWRRMHQLLESAGLVTYPFEEDRVLFRPHPPLKEAILERLPLLLLALGVSILVLVVAWILVLRRVVKRRTLELAEQAGKAMETNRHLKAEMQRNAKTQAELAESRAILQQSLETAEMGVMQLDLGRRRLVLSSRAKEILRVEGEGREGFREFLRRIHPEDWNRLHHSWRLARRPEGNGNLRMDLRLVWPDGQERWVSAIGAFRESPDGSPRLVGTVVDITLSRNAEIELAEASRKKDELLAVLGHELRNPLATLRNALGMLRLAREDASVHAKAVEMLDRQSRRLTRIVEDLIDATHAFSGQMSFRPEILELRGFMHSFIEDYRAQITGKGLRMVADLGDEERIWVQVDSRRLTQALSNIVHNAWKFTDRGGTIRVNLRTDPDSSRACIEVADNGMGMDPSSLRKLQGSLAFPVSHLDRLRQGLGLGISLVRRILVLHNGELKIESPGQGRGTRVFVSLPLYFRTSDRDRDSDTSEFDPQSPASSSGELA